MCKMFFAWEQVPLFSISDLLLKFTFESLILFLFCKLLRGFKRPRCTHSKHQLSGSMQWVQFCTLGFCSMLLQCAMDDSPTMFKLVISKTRKKFMVDRSRLQLAENSLASVGRMDCRSPGKTKKVWGLHPEESLWPWLSHQREIL